MFVFTCLSCTQSVTLKGMISVLSKTFLLHKMQVNSKTFVVDLWSEISLVCLVYSLKLIGIKFSITATAFCFYPFFVVRSYINKLIHLHKIVETLNIPRKLAGRIGTLRGPDFGERWFNILMVLFLILQICCSWNFFAIFSENSLY